jgi:hypothetical protein
MIKIGDRFGRLAVIQYIGITDDHKATTWMCRCDCGALKECRGGNLISGHIKSCGCFRREFSKANNTTHGEASSRSGKRTVEYEAWVKMIFRCYNTGDNRYRDYGGRGIKVYAVWKDSFIAFLEYIGRRPGKRYSLHRIDNDGNYEPGNVKWATASEQARHRRSNRMLTINGISRTLIEWAELSGHSFKLIHSRICKLGWPAKKAVFQSMQIHHRKEDCNG